MLDSFTQCLDLAESKRGRTALEKVALFGEFLEVGLLTRRRRRILSGSVGAGTYTRSVIVSRVSSA